MTLEHLIVLSAFYLAAGLLLDRLIHLGLGWLRAAAKSRRVLQTEGQPDRAGRWVSAAAVILGATLTGLLLHEGGARPEVVALLVTTLALLVEELGQRCPADMLPDTLHLLTASLAYRVGTGTLFEALDKAEAGLQNPLLQQRLREVLSLRSYTTVSLPDSLLPLAIAENRYLKSFAAAVVDANGLAGPALDARIKPLIEAAERDWRSPALRWLLRPLHQQAGRMAAIGALGVAALGAAPLAMAAAGGLTLGLVVGLAAVAVLLYLVIEQPWLRRAAAVVAVALLAGMIATSPQDVQAGAVTPLPTATLKAAPPALPSPTPPPLPTATLPELVPPTPTASPTFPVLPYLTRTARPTATADDDDPEPTRTPGRPTAPPLPSGLPPTATAPVLPTPTAPNPQPSLTAPPLATATAPSLSGINFKE